MIVSNYPSFYAGFALIGVFSRASIVAHAFVKKVPLLGQVLNRVGTIFVQPGRAGQGRRAIDLELNECDIAPSVIILPEGARTPDGKIHRFRRGFIYILRQTSLDLLPVTLNGLYQLKPMRRLYIDPDAEPEMVIHAPVCNSTARQMSDKELAKMVQRVIDRAIQIHGAIGTSNDLPLERFYRTMRILKLGGGSMEMMRMLIARYVLQ